MGALKFRASDISEAVPSERFVIMEVRAHSLHTKVTGVSEWSRGNLPTLRRIHKSPSVNAGQLMGERARGWIDSYGFCPRTST